VGKLGTKRRNKSFIFFSFNPICLYAGYRDGEDPVPRDGVRQWRGGVRLPRPTRQDEGEGGQSQVQTNSFRCPVLSSEENNSQVSSFDILTPPPPFHFSS